MASRRATPHRPIRWHPCAQKVWWVAGASRLAAGPRGGAQDVPVDSCAAAKWRHTGWHGVLADAEQGAFATRDQFSSRDDMRGAQRAIAGRARLTYGWMGRTPDYKAAFSNTLGGFPEYYGAFADNARNGTSVRKRPSLS
jgi:hypothetical protein